MVSGTRDNPPPRDNFTEPLCVYGNLNFIAHQSLSGQLGRLHIGQIADLGNHSTDRPTDRQGRDYLVIQALQTMPCGIFRQFYCNTVRTRNQRGCNSRAMDSPS